MDKVDTLIRLYTLHFGDKQPVEMLCSPACRGSIDNLHEQLYLHGKAPFPPAPAAVACADHSTISYDAGDPAACQCVADYVRLNPEYTLAHRPCNPLFCRTFSVPQLLYNEQTPAGTPRWVPPWERIFVCAKHHMIHACYDDRPGCHALSEGRCSACTSGAGVCNRNCTYTPTTDHRGYYCLFSGRELPKIVPGAGYYGREGTSETLSIDMPGAGLRRRMPPRHCPVTEMYNLLQNWIESAFARYRSRRQCPLTPAQISALLYEDLVAPHRFTYDAASGRMTLLARDIWSVLGCLPPLRRLDLGAVEQPDQPPPAPPPAAQDDEEHYDFDLDNPDNPLLRRPAAAAPRPADSFVECAMYLYNAANTGRVGRARCTLLRVLEIFRHNSVYASASGLRCQSSAYFRKVCTILVHFPHPGLGGEPDGTKNAMFDALEDYQIYHLVNRFRTFFFWYIPLYSLPQINVVT